MSTSTSLLFQHNGLLGRIGDLKEALGKAMHYIIVLKSGLMIGIALFHGKRLKHCAYPKQL